jgi:hypothetical protein
MHSTVLQLDIQGTPQAWITLEQAALHYTTDSVAWAEGESPLAVLRGGWNAVTGRQSRIGCTRSSPCAGMRASTCSRCPSA